MSSDDLTEGRAEGIVRSVAGVLDHLPFHAPLVAELNEIRGRIYGRCLDRYSKLSGAPRSDMVVERVAQEELRALRRTAATVRERFLYFHLAVRLGFAEAWAVEDDSERAGSRRDRARPRDVWLRLFAEISDALEGHEDEALSLGLENHLEERAAQELHFLQAEALVGLLRQLDSSTILLEYPPTIKRVASSLKMMLEDIKTRELSREEAIALLVSMSDAAPFRLDRELKLILAKPGGIEEEEVPWVGIGHVFEWLGGDSAAGVPCRHGRVNLLVAEGLNRRRDWDGARRLLAAFIAAPPEKLNPQRTLATIYEQRAARRMLESLP